MLCVKVAVCQRLQQINQVEQQNIGTAGSGLNNARRDSAAQELCEPEVRVRTSNEVDRAYTGNEMYGLSAETEGSGAAEIDPGEYCEMRISISKVTCYSSREFGITVRKWRECKSLTVRIYFHKWILLVMVHIGLGIHA